jgi:hypothetical protein
LTYCNFIFSIKMKWIELIAEQAAAASSPADDVATSRTQARKRSTTGLRVRFYLFVFRYLGVKLTLSHPNDLNGLLRKCKTGSADKIAVHDVNKSAASTERTPPFNLSVDRTGGGVVYYRVQIFFDIPLPPTRHIEGNKMVSFSPGANIMALRAERLLVDFRRRLRRQEETIGVVVAMLLAMTTVAVTYLYY